MAGFAIGKLGKCSSDTGTGAICSTVQVSTFDILIFSSASLSFPSSFSFQFPTIFHLLVVFSILF